MNRFWLFGVDIVNSPSPIMHRTAFALLNKGELRYDLARVSDVNDIARYFALPEFLGCSITMPFKQEVG